MSKLYCQYSNHEESQILGVCLNEKCQNSRVYCVACKVEFHRGHENELMYFVQLKYWIAQCLKTQENLRNFQGLILQLANLLNETMNHMNSNKNQDITSMSVSELEHFIVKLMALKSIETQTNLQIKNLTNEIGSFQTLIKTVLNSSQILDNQKKKEKSPKNEQMQMQSINQLKQDCLVFSDKYRSVQNIQMDKNGKQASGIGFILCDYVIPKNKETILTFKFVSGFSIALGLCHIDKPIEVNYQEKLSNVGHGLYLIQSNSMSYSHLDPLINNKSQKIKIFPDDIINLKINTKQQQLTWIVNKKEIFTMTINTTKDLYPIVDICGVVEIVDEY